MVRGCLRDFSLFAYGSLPTTSQPIHIECRRWHVPEPGHSDYGRIAENLGRHGNPPMGDCPDLFSKSGCLFGQARQSSLHVVEPSSASNWILTRYTRLSHR
jgi:hypothetical protein